ALEASHVELSASARYLRGELVRDERHAAQLHRREHDEHKQRHRHRELHDLASPLGIIHHDPPSTVSSIVPTAAASYENPASPSPEAVAASAPTDVRYVPFNRRATRTGRHAVCDGRSKNDPVSASKRRCA